ncbi:MAG: PKD domain-containing protein [Ferruginibacter sp.]
MTIRTIILLLFTFIITGAKAQTADFTYSTSNGFFCNPQSVSFTQNCTGAPIRFIWNFGNGQSGSNPTANITYSTPGTYTISLTAIYEDNAVTTSKIIVINPTPALALTADKNYLCQPGNIVFTVTTAAFITSYEWDFGDGSPILTTPGNSNSIIHNFTTYNSFNTTVKGITANGCAATAGYTVQVKKFSVTGSVNPASGCIPMNSLLSVTTNLPPGDTNQNFVWDFGDGSPIINGTTNSINHLYNITAPITTASVTISSVQGCTNQFTFNTFAFGTPPFGTVAKTVAARDTFCGSETLQFFGKATTANSYYWDFDDGTNTTITDTLVSHKYKTLGNKRVIITPYFNGCAGLKDTIDIFIEGVIADYTFSNTCGNKNVYSFSNQSLGNIDHFEWTFSDTPLIDSVNYNITHTFPASGVYSTYLFLRDNSTGCTDVLYTPIFTARPSFSSSKTAVCKDSLIIYKVNNTYPANSGYTYEFHVNGNIINTNGDSALSFLPGTHGDFTEYVVIKDPYTSTCNDSLYLTAGTRVRGPVVDFTSTARVCNDTSVRLTNNSVPFFGTDNIVKWIWDFGDSKKDSVKNPLPHLYASPGNFSITLTAKDMNGCGGKIIRVVTIDPVPAIDVFPAIDTICQKDTAILRAYTSDTLLWMPGTNINCTTCDTVKVYPNITTSYIARAINSFGCKSYDTALVKVYGPISLQVFPADTTICPGKPIPYALNTTGITLWSPATFLNNNKIKNPVAIPDTAINYTVIVRDSIGCYADTAFAFVHVYPKPFVDAGPDLILPYNTPYTLAPMYSNDVISYLWSPPGNLNCTNCANPSGIALKKEIYQVEVVNNYGCKATDIINVLVKCEKAYLLMPTAFTPNKDGTNDYFYPITRGYRTVKTFLIFNRLGNKIFERKDFAPNTASLGWNGTVKDDTYATAEVFAWYMEAECDTGQLVTIKGTVVLIR